MRRSYGWSMCVALSAGAWACSSSSGNSSLVSFDARALCNQLVNSCGDTNDGTVDQCTATFSALRVSQTCANDLKTASCNDLEADTSALTAACFPTCNAPGTFTCGVGTLTECVNGGIDGGVSRSLTVDCATACTNNNTTYTGTCGNSYGGQTADHAQCWCK